MGITYVQTQETLSESVVLDGVSVALSVWHKYIYVEFMVDGREECLTIDLEEAIRFKQAIDQAITKLKENYNER